MHWKELKNNLNTEDLKNKILQLAVQGKLVEQDPNDEPASVLLKKIQKEKERLVKEKKIRKSKPLPPITEDEIPFEIPEGWEWVRLGEISSQISSKQYQIKQSEIVKTGLYPVVSQSQKIIEGYSNNEDKLIKLENPVIIFGDHTRCVKYIDFDFIIGADGVKVINPVGICSKYMYISLLYNALNIIDRGYSRHFQFLNRKLISLPPLKEQKRIAKKVDELFTIIKQLENNKDELLKTIENTRNMILQSAVQGKLVPQYPTDEPASILLEKIKEEKERLIKEKKIKKSKPLPPITEDEIPFELPDGWEWVRLGNLLLKLTDGTHKTPPYTASGVPFISVKDISNGKIDFSDTKFISQKTHEKLFKRCNPEFGDLLLTKVGTTGIPVIVDTDIEFSLFVSVALLKFNNQFISNRYLMHLINSPFIKEKSEENTRGVGNKNLVLRDIANFAIPLPPLNEQKRIAEKVDILIALCDELEEQIIESRKGTGYEQARGENAPSQRYRLPPDFCRIRSLT
jgi:type I restriction enzyme S subunit